MTKFHYNPLLVARLTNINIEDIPPIPAVSDLPGKFVQVVHENFKSAPRAFPKNIQMLSCGSCNKKARYDLGRIAINVENYQKDQPGNVDQYIQSTGYFRCKRCNSAGNWVKTHEYEFMLLSALMSVSSQIENELFVNGAHQLFDGSIHQYSTDAEDHLLTLVVEDDKNALLWNRLGNLYFKGGRPDLAVAAFEHSLSIDPLQLESLYSLGMILEEIEPNEAANFYHKMLISAPTYTVMETKPLRNLLALALQGLVFLNSNSGGVISVIPPRECYAELNLDLPSGNEGPDMIFDGVLNTEDIQTFYPLVELFMGERRHKLPKQKR